jgi:hypothetical protein
MLWSPSVEKELLERLVTLFPVSTLFYFTEEGRWLFYWEKGYKGKKYTLQQRNSLIGKMGEKWFLSILERVGGEGWEIVHNWRGEGYGLPRGSEGDIVLLVGGVPKIVFEVKISFLWNWEYIPKEGRVRRVEGKHLGVPSLLRSDSFLKGIGKGVKIKVSPEGRKIGYWLIGNTPIGKRGMETLPRIINSGIIDKVVSVGPKMGEGDGLTFISREEEFKELITEEIKVEKFFFGKRYSLKEIGEIVEKANRGKTLPEKGKLFLELIY